MKHHQRPEIKVEIEAVIPLRGRTIDEITELLTHEITWRFDAEAVSVTEVEP